MVLSVYFLHAVKIPIARCLEMAVGCRAFHSHYSGVINFTLLVGRRGAGGNGLTIKKKKSNPRLRFQWACVFNQREI